MGYQLKSHDDKIILSHLLYMDDIKLFRFNYHHPKSAVERLVLPRKLGGRGLINDSNFQGKIIESIREYFFKKATTSILHKIISYNDNNFTPLNLQDQTLREGSNNIENTMLQKPLHGRFFNEIQECIIRVAKKRTSIWRN